MKMLNLSLFYSLVLVSCSHNATVGQNGVRVEGVETKATNLTANVKPKKTCEKGSLVNINGNTHTHPVDTTKNYRTIRHKHQQGACAHTHNYSR